MSVTNTVFSAMSPSFWEVVTAGLQVVSIVVEERDDDGDTTCATEEDNFTEDLTEEVVCEEPWEEDGVSGLRLEVALAAAAEEEVFLLLLLGFLVDVCAFELLDS